MNYKICDNRPEHFFETAEEAWMWFCFCESTPKYRKDSCRPWSYPCEPADMAIIVKRLVKEKKITQEQIKVLSKYGLLQTPPHQNSGDSPIVCRLWKQALERIFDVLRGKGLMSLSGRAFLF